jgi:hypothetical protein
MNANELQELRVEESLTRGKTRKLKEQLEQKLTYFFSLKAYDKIKICTHCINSLL